MIPIPSLSRRHVLLLSGVSLVALSLPRRGLAEAQAVEGALDRFHTPARITDLADEPALQAALDEAWNINATGWTEQAIQGNPWTSLYASAQDYYFNPLKTDLRGGLQEMVTCPAFPNRIAFYYPQLTTAQQWEMADTGVVAGMDLPPIPQAAECAALAGTPITPDSPRIAYGPYGPRGWLDEYCEMARRIEQVNGAPTITEIHFTCENPEYWYTLWSVSPDRVLALYREVLGNDAIQMGDLELMRDGQPVIDPATGRPAYDPLNRWNAGTTMTPEGGGAMHLTSTPNTIQTEMQLAGGATVQRAQGNLNSSALICCGQFGQIYRNSDPHIGQLDNQMVGLGYRVSLADPIGLYLQMPSFGAWTLPDDPALPADAEPRECWQILRGAETLEGFPAHMSFLLHVRVAIPDRWRAAGVGFNVGDIMINGQKIAYASQVMQTFNVALFPLGVEAAEPAPRLGCVAPRNPALAQPQQLMFAALWDAYYASSYEVAGRLNPDGSPVVMNLASNTVITAPRIARGSTAQMALAGSAFSRDGDTLPLVEFVLPGESQPDGAISVEVTALEDVSYAVPGNSVPGPQTLLRLSVSVAADAALEGRDLRVTNPGQQPADAAKWFLWVVDA